MIFGSKHKEIAQVRVAKDPGKKFRSRLASYSRTCSYNMRNKIECFWKTGSYWGFLIQWKLLNCTKYLVVLDAMETLNYTGCPKIKVMRLINNGTNAFRLIFKISFVSDKCDIKLHLDISVLKIRQILTELQELEDQNAVNHETSELCQFGCYLGVHVRMENFSHTLNWCQEFIFIFTQLIFDN